MERVNGERLNPAEDIRGYSIRYRHESESTYKTVFLDDNLIDSYHFDNLQFSSGYIFQIAVVDKAGLYSDFVTAQR